MLDEFENTTPPVPRRHADRRDTGSADPVPRLVTRLVTRLYASGDARLRARLLRRLLDPLGSLGLAAIAAGAFAVFLQRRSAEGIRVSLDDVGRYSSEQVAELVRFAVQVSPDTVRAVAEMCTEQPAAMTAFGAATIVLLVRALEHAGARGVTGRRRPGA